ncbi:Ribosomal RNA small subunit methyltransferase B [Legionella geestiana]|uniref:16S rRNA (cytosine(967)-C(5))-methyltransferase n=1 Tax=Legionella geestiana TaxID=45065 RepID=A0A0W0U7Q5_9GAMM|nr:16S rRNA (cytosine(967)-C(5))-methyltransferase RsmB [Legionella geestiana]KTD03793.1 Ribosomal RNA small subunit methyltransferase B [Legionella geestiana]QBS11921.1 16S rRNA (cytosine(967)-C(5))-methyltransferase RsmB [Legionella geestiana]STX53366.1 16S rRNA m5C967 methyltransferase, S-adenosyl-L -methionine-dependent [Legionella geestiana]
MNRSPRTEALHVLTCLLDKRIPLSHQLQGVSPHAKVLVFGVSRQYYRLVAVADCLMQKRPAKTAVFVAILMGLCELLYLDTPEHAVVSETVGLLRGKSLQFARGFVNALLRRACREKAELQAFLLTLEDKGLAPWLAERIKSDWPHHAGNILAASDCQAPMTLRVNARQSSVSEYLKRLQDSGIEASACQFSADGVVLKVALDVADVPGFFDGVVSVQDEAAQLACALLEVQPHMRVLDACCAPGGKLCHILEQANAEVTGVDADASRMRRVEENCTRLGISPRLLVGDAAHPHTWWDGRPFDRILLDAPCSATGVIRRHPDIRLLRTPKDVETVVVLQRQLLDALWPLLAPGGMLVYATCSILQAENAHQIAGFVAGCEDCLLETPSTPWGHKSDFGTQILPGESGMDGFFYSVLRKKTL